MKISTILISSLATVASAIDIRYHSRGFYNCDQQWFAACVGINPNVCCTNPDAGGGSEYVSVRAIPTNWNIKAVAGKDCGYTIWSGTNNGTPNICIHQTGGTDGDDYMRGTYYFFQGSKKRSASGSLCTGSQRANYLSFGPDLQYDLQHAGEEDYQRLIEIYKNHTKDAHIAATTVPHIPDEFKHYKVT